MEFEWDEAKRLSNLAKHKLDFLNADLVLEGLNVLQQARSAGSETRWAATGLVKGVRVTVIFTERGANTRIISMRRARPNERAGYQALHGGTAT